MGLCVEQCTSISCSTLQSGIRRMINRDYPKSTEEDIFKYTQEELRKFEIGEQRFKFLSINNQLGGFRWFFLCPKCEQKVIKLFLPPRGTFLTHEQKYLCKKCHHLKNESALKANNKLYQTVLKPLKRLRDIEKKLEIGHLKEEKIDELLNEYAVIEDRMKATPEYRLYLFKKKRNLPV
jgi:hypothetical protein